MLRPFVEYFEVSFSKDYFELRWYIHFSNYTFIFWKKHIQTSVKAISMQSSSQTISFSWYIQDIGQCTMLTLFSWVFWLSKVSLLQSTGWILSKLCWTPLLVARTTLALNVHTNRATQNTELTPHLNAATKMETRNNGAKTRLNRDDQTFDWFHG